MADDGKKPKDTAKIAPAAPPPGANKLAPKQGRPDDKGGTNPPENVNTKKNKKKDIEREQKILATMMKRFDRCIQAEGSNRKAMVEDGKFLAGEQWDPKVLQTREADSRPALTINKLPTFVHQVTNAMREERPTINVNPVGDKSDPEVAKMYRGLIRHIERASAAEIAYDTGFENCVAKGLGFWRVITEYEGPNTFQQCIRIQRIRNIFTVYLDPDRMEPDGSDSRFGFITDMIPRHEFEETWPNADPVSFELSGQGDKFKEWTSKESVRIAEYFDIVHEKRTLVLLSNGHEGWEDELADEVKGMIAAGTIEIKRKRESQVPSVKWYKATAKEILEEADWIGKSIPIVQINGDEFDIEGRVSYAGIVRFSKDAQKMYNFWRCLSLDTPLPTPSGWTTMGAVETGDTLFDENGKPCKVLGTSPIHVHRDCYEVVFDDGSKIVADANHLWKIEDRGIRKTSNWDWHTKIVTTTDLKPGKHFIYTAKPLEIDEPELPIHPYFLGAWLGDGNSAEPRICAGDKDIDEMREHLSGFGLKLGHIGRAPGKIGAFGVLGLRHEFVKLRLLGNKHIPKAYLRASREQREMLLQGMMDTDGSVTSKTRHCSYTTTSTAIAEGLTELLRTLGIKAISTVRSREARMFPGGNVCQVQDCWQFSFSCGPDDNVFRLRRKVRSLKSGGPRHIRRTKRFAIREVNRVLSVPVKCVKVDSPSHLFLAGESMVPTHNTKETEAIALAPNAPWVVEEGQIEGHEADWKAANRKPIAVLQYKGVAIAGSAAPPPQRQAFAGVPQGIVQAAQGAAQDMMATTGIRFDATSQDALYDESGRALREHRRTGDIGSFHFTDNLARGLKYTGEILIDIIPKVYDTKRVLTILRDDDSEERIVLDPDAGKPMGETKDPQTKKVMKVFNPTIGKFGVTVTIGPSYATKRVESAESMMDFIRAMPQTGEMLSDLVAKNQDWPGAPEMATRLAKVIAMKFPGVMQPDMKDVTPQVQAVLSQMQQQLQKAGVERQQMIKALTDRQADRALEKEKIDKDFEAKLTKIAADLEAKTAATQQAGIDAIITHVAAMAQNMEKVFGHKVKAAIAQNSSDQSAAAAESKDDVPAQSPG